ncbi:P27 family phage terminase small subunit [uncultured Roseibium sp.]|uniref:P27 family phage terminase small subunit n=1 Tax=uncultured Roseibium sp. TaxID=1936171 RepID=UPI00261821C0|nr:P27 family phage terminase small subunit [uncultured Roseibium sp.]
MPRRKDDPLLQAAKGFPGRRRKKVEAELEAAAEAAEKQPAPIDDPFPVPELFKKAPAYWKQATQVWQQCAAVLKAANRRRPGYRAALTRYCIWTQLYMSSAERLRKDCPNGGTTYKQKLGHGDTTIRTHPSVDFMAKAETALRLLDAEFGFTPMRDQDLLKVESFNASQGKLPFDTPPARAGGAKPDPTGFAGSDPMDLMNESDSVPPTGLPN